MRLYGDNPRALARGLSPYMRTNHALFLTCASEIGHKGTSEADTVSIEVPKSIIWRLYSPRLITSSFVRIRLRTRGYDIVVGG